jgi:Sulfatase
MIRSAARTLGSTPPYPVLFTLAWTIGIFTASGEPIGYFWRPFLLILGTALLALLVLGLVTRRPRAAAFGFSIAWFLFLIAWVILLPLIVVALWRVVVDWVRRRSGRRALKEPAMAQITKVANYYSILLLTVTAATALLSLSWHFGTAAPVASADSGTPNVYVLMLDGYPRADTLEGLGIDNSSFISGLESRGFNVSSHSRSNYNTTMLSLGALFDGAYVPLDSGAPPPLVDREVWELRKRADELQDGRMLAALHDHGYLLATIPSAFGAPSLLNADIILDHPHLTQLEYRYMHQTLLVLLIDKLAPHWIADQWADAVDGAFDEVQAFSREERNAPVFMFAHVMSPHPPIVFDAAGGRPDTGACYYHGCGWGPKLTQMGLTLDQYVPLLSGQISHLDDRVIETVDAIVADDPNAVILVFSDHGGRYEEEITDEFFHSLFAARTPGQQDPFPDDMSLTNTLPLLLNAYFGDSYQVLPYRAWESDDNSLTMLRERSVSP